MSTQQTLRKGRLSDELVLRLACEIVSGRLKAGHSVPSESELADQFGVSQPVVRESLQRLASCGLVRVHQGKRAVVREEVDWNTLEAVVQEAFRIENLSDALALDLYKVRLIIEPAAAAAAAGTAPNGRLEELRVHVDQMRAIARGTRNVLAFLAHDRAFHDLIAEFTGNRVLRGMMSHLHRFAADSWSTSRVTADELEIILDYHAEIAEAIIAGDSRAASAAMERHLIWASQVELGPRAASHGEDVQVPSDRDDGDIPTRTD